VVPCDGRVDQTKANELASIRASAERVGQVGWVARLAQPPIYMKGISWSEGHHSDIEHHRRRSAKGGEEPQQGAGDAPAHQAALHEGWHEVLVIVVAWVMGCANAPTHHSEVNASVCRRPPAS